MANLIGGIPPHSGVDNLITGTNGDDVIFGDPFTTGNSHDLAEDRRTAVLRTGAATTSCSVAAAGTSSSAMRALSRATAGAVTT